MVRACMRRQADVWTMIVTFGSTIGRMTSDDTITTTVSTNSAAITARRVIGWYYVVCQNGSIYLSNTGEVWRVLTGTRSLYRTDVDDYGYVYATEYSPNSFSRIIYTRDYVNWNSLVAYYSGDYWVYFYALYCKYYNGYVYATVERYYNVSFEIQILSPAATSYYYYASDMYGIKYSSGVGTTIYSLSLPITKVCELHKSKTIYSKYILTYCCVNVQSATVMSYYYYDYISSHHEIEYVTSNIGITGVPVLDCVYYDSKYYVMTTSVLYESTNLSSYTPVLSFFITPIKIRTTNNKVYIGDYGKYYVKSGSSSFVTKQPTAVAGKTVYDFAGV